MSIAALLQAAEYLERRERESVDHGYASSLPVSTLDVDRHLVGVAFRQRSDSSLSASSSGSASSAASGLKRADSAASGLNHRGGGGGANRRAQMAHRSTHNELEKNRRAHLRNCLERLKDIVPLGADSSRHTTLGLLNKAKHFIKTLEEKDRKTLSHKENLLREQRYLRRRLELLSSQMDAIHKRRSVSECSATSTGSSNHSSNSESDDHEVDIVSYHGSSSSGVSDDDLLVRTSVSLAEKHQQVAITSWTRQLTIADEQAAGV